MQRIIQDWRDIFRGMKMSLDFNRLVLSFLGIILSIVWSVIILTSFNSLGLLTIRTSALTNNFLFATHPNFSGLFATVSDTFIDAGLGEYVALTMLALGLLAIWSLVGGAITRSVALEFAQDEKLPFKKSILFALENFWSYFWAPIIPVLGMLFFIVCNIIGGFIGQIKYVGEVALALGFPLAIISGFFIACIGTIGVIGFFLMFPTISAEGSDCFDALSRSYSYVLARPKRFISLVLSIIVCGTAFAFLVNGIACLIMQTSFTTVGFGMGQKFDSIRALLSGSVDPAIQGRGGTLSFSTWSLKFFTVMLMIYLALVKVVVGSLVVSFAGAACTISYFILRKDIDGTEIDDVYCEETGTVFIDEKLREATTIEQECNEKGPTGESDVSPSAETSQNGTKSV